MSKLAHEMDRSEFAELIESTNTVEDYDFIKGEAEQKAFNAGMRHSFRDYLDYECGRQELTVLGAYRAGKAVVSDLSYFLPCDRDKTRYQLALEAYEYVVNPPVHHGALLVVASSSNGGLTYSKDIKQQANIHL